MTYSDDSYDLLAIVDGEEHSIISDADAVDCLADDEPFGSGRTRILGQTIHRGVDPVLNVARQLSEAPVCMSKNTNAIGHSAGRRDCRCAFDSSQEIVPSVFASAIPARAPSKSQRFSSSSSSRTSSIGTTAASS